MLSTKNLTNSSKKYKNKNQNNNNKTRNKKSNNKDVKRQSLEIRQKHKDDEKLIKRNVRKIYITIMS